MHLLQLPLMVVCVHSFARGNIGSGTHCTYCYAEGAIVSNSYNMDARALACLLHEGAKRPRAINELSARASML